MISLELAKELKAAGLVWEPKPGDWYYNTKHDQPVLITESKLVKWEKQAKQAKIKVWQRIILLPRLDQLLAEIEARGYRWRIGKLHTLNPHYSCSVFGKGVLECEEFTADTAVNAAAKALLWIQSHDAQKPL